MSFGLFDVFGVELEYMIVDAASLAVKPIADKLLIDDSGDVCLELPHGDITWCNELARHVVEFKFSEPWQNLDGATERFAAEINEANKRLTDHGACLLPTAMHPTMDPLGELELWPHGQQEIYAAYDAIFSCRGHGWANLQSTHINLPFASDDDFVRLHAAIRVVLPLLPALAASSPMMDGRLTGRAANRLFVYRDNAKRIPSLAGRVVPESIASIDEYHERILAPMYRDIAPFDPDGILQEDWLNSRGAIARFERQSIEIRLLDIQECPAADMSIVQTVVELVRSLVEERTCSLADQQRLDTDELAAILWRCAEHGEGADLTDSPFPAILDIPSARSAHDIWSAVMADQAERQDAFAVCYRRHGTLASRIRRELEAGRSIASVYQQLANSLAANRLFA